MSSLPEKRKLPRRKPFSTQMEMTIHLHAGPHLAARRKTGLFAKLIDCATTDGVTTGLRLELAFPIEEGATVNIAGHIDSIAGRQAVEGPCQVRWCSEIAVGKFIAGLSFLAAGERSARSDSPSDVDFYEVLQLSRSADTETIRRVFHVMAARYHPDNKDTGNPDQFRRVVEAHDVLSDPERRAGFDARLATQTQARLRLFRNWEEAQGVEAEIRKRQGILRLLYGKRLTDAHAPTLSARDFEEMLGVPREHLEFSFWLLKESKLLTRSDNNRFEITVQGVLAFEAEERSAVNLAATKHYRPGLMLEQAGAQR